MSSRWSVVLTDLYGIVVDDVVLRTWGNGQAELNRLLLTSAVESSGSVVDARVLWSAARSIAYPDRDDPPWPQGEVRDGSASPDPTERGLEVETQAAHPSPPRPMPQPPYTSAT